MFDRRLRVVAAVLCAMVVVVGCDPAGGAVTLVDDGEPKAVIVIPAEPAEAEQQAADELIEHIELISGAVLSVISAEADADGLTPIRIGRAADEAIDDLIREQGDDPWALALVVDDRAVQLRGLSPDGSRTAAYELLEQLGVRWFMPGEIGRVIPEKRTIVLDEQETVQVPSYEFRRRSGDFPDWGDRLRMPGEGGRYGAHGMRPLRGSAARRYFEEDPRLFARIDGERQQRQLCLTYSTDDIEENRTLELIAEYYREYLRENPETEVLHMGPNDGGGFCECAHCRALDPPDHVTTPMRTPAPSRTDRYVWFWNQLTAKLADEFPDVRVGFYAYGALQLPPHHVEPQDNLAISVAPIHTCRIHGPNNPVCPESNYPLWLFEQWDPYVDGHIADRGYLFNLAGPGYAFSMVHRLREEIPAFHDHGVRSWNADPSSAWATHNPSMYIAAKLLWDHTADVDALLEDFYDKYYGPAREPMAAYHELIDSTLRDADHHTGSTWDFPHIFTEAVRGEARAHLDEAEQRVAPDTEYATRVEITRKGFAFTDAYARSQAKRNQHDFVGEMELMRRLEELRATLRHDYEIPMLARHADMFLNRFTTDYGTERHYLRDDRSSIRGRSDIRGYTRVTGGNEMIVGFDARWRFQQDPEEWGQYVGLHKPGSEGGNWQTIRTDTSWSNQGLRYYFGQTWYRQTVEMPEGYEDRTVKLWFSGVDNTAEVWVNGQWVGANHDGAEFDLDAFGSAFQPFEFDVTNAIRHGEPNVVTVRSYRTGTNELGTGGLVGPVMFYAAADTSDP